MSRASTVDSGFIGVDFTVFMRRSFRWSTLLSSLRVLIDCCMTVANVEELDLKEVVEEEPAVL